MAIIFPSPPMVELKNLALRTCRLFLFLRVLVVTTKFLIFQKSLEEKVQCISPPFRVNARIRKYMSPLYRGRIGLSSCPSAAEIGSAALGLKGLEKKYTAVRIMPAPIVNCPPIGVPKSKVDTPVAKQTLTPVASPFKTLSAYLIIAATKRPPPACKLTNTQTQVVKP